MFSTYDVELILFCYACTVQPMEFEERYSLFPHGNCRLRFKRGSDVLKIYISFSVGEPISAERNMHLRHMHQ